MTKDTDQRKWSVEQAISLQQNTDMVSTEKMLNDAEKIYLFINDKSQPKIKEKEEDTDNNP